MALHVRIHQRGPKSAGQPSESGPGANAPRRSVQVPPQASPPRLKDWFSARLAAAALAAVLPAGSKLAALLLVLTLIFEHDVLPTLSDEAADALSRLVGGDDHAIDTSPLHARLAAIFGEVNTVRYLTLEARHFAHSPDAQKWLVLVYGLQRIVGKTTAGRMRVDALRAPGRACVVDEASIRSFTVGWTNQEAAGMKAKLAYNGVPFLLLDETAANLRHKGVGTRKEAPLDMQALKRWQNDRRPLFPPGLKSVRQEKALVWETIDRLVVATANVEKPSDMLLFKPSDGDARLVLPIGVDEHVSKDEATQKKNAAALGKLVESDEGLLQYLALMVQYSQYPVNPDGAWPTLDRVLPMEKENLANGRVEALDRWFADEAKTPRFVKCADGSIPRSAILKVCGCASLNGCFTQTMTRLPQPQGGPCRSGSRVGVAARHQSSDG